MRWVHGKTAGLVDSGLSTFSLITLSGKRSWWTWPKYRLLKNLQSNRLVEMSILWGTKGLWQLQAKMQVNEDLIINGNCSEGNGPSIFSSSYILHLSIPTSNTQRVTTWEFVHFIRLILNYLNYSRCCFAEPSGGKQSRSFISNLVLGSHRRHNHQCNTIVSVCWKILIKPLIHPVLSGQKWKFDASKHHNLSWTTLELDSWVLVVAKLQC